MKFLLLIIFLSFLFSITIFYSITNWYTETYDATIKWSDYMKSKNKTNDEQILILGSSHISALNATYIQKKLEENKINYEIYNLSIGGDYPSRRLVTVDNLIELSPKIVIYGIDIRMFQKHSSNQNFETLDNNNFLPSPKQILEISLNPIINDENSPQFPKNPKLVTKNLLNLFLRNSTIIHVADLDSNHPFTPANRQYDKIATVSELEEDLENRYPTFPKIGSPESNSEFISLMKIIEKFEKNGIKVIIFATPSQKLLLDNIPNEILDDFDSYFVYIDSNSNANVSSFYSKYENLNVWSDVSHIAVNKQVLSYSDDITELILRSDT